MNLESKKGTQCMRHLASYEGPCMRHIRLLQDLEGSIDASYQEAIIMTQILDAQLTYINNLTVTPGLILYHES